jgi:hypothetical protein
MFPANRSFSPPTSVTRSPSSTVEFVQSANFRVFETTNFGIEFILSAKPASSSIDGQALAKPSYVRRPSSCASAARSSSILNLSPSAPRSNLNVQPPCS